MHWLFKRPGFRQRGAALIIVLAFVVLFTGLAVAYLSRTTGDRQVAQGSFNQSTVDQLVQSAVDNIIGDLRQEITNGSTPITDTNGNIVGYLPKDTGSGAAANMVPQRSGNAAGAPNLIRRSVNPDSLSGNPAPPSRASAVNSQNNPSANGRSISSTRWNGHYLVPKKNAGTDESIPIDAFTSKTPDWAFVTREYGADMLANPNTDSNGNSVTVVGRYAYAVYAEGGLLDMNVAGYPTDAVASTATIRPGRKGSVAYADLKALGSTDANRFSNPDAAGVYQVDRLVGWRNYGTTQPSNNFPDTGSQAFAKNFQTDTTATRPATGFYNYVLNNTNGFLSPITGIAPNGRTDQAFLQRQQLIAFRKTVGSTTSVSADVLKYLGTFSRETNAPSFSPPLNASEMGGDDQGGLYAYRTNATSATAVNPNFLSRLVTTGFTRFDGTTAAVGEPLVKTRFPLSRLAWITYNGPSASRTLPPQSPTLLPTDPNYDMWALQWVYGIPASYLRAGTATNVQACFGLTFGGTTGAPWTYSHGAANRILRLDEVAGSRREPDFFELLQAGILSGSLGQNTALPPGTSGGGVTGGNVWDVSYMSNTTQHILSIGAAIIDQADPDSIPTRIQFTGTNDNTWTAYGVENLPYITQIYPIAGTSPNDPNPSTPTIWGTYLLFQLWNPYQNPPAALPVTVRLRVDGAIGIFTGSTWTTGNPPQIIANGANSGQSVTLNSTFSAPTPLTNSNTTGWVAAPGPSTGGAFAGLTAPTFP